MGWVLRRSTDKVNPTLPGGVYGKYITAGRGVYWRHDGARVRFIVFISDGGLYGMNAPSVVEYKAVPIPGAEYKFHPGRYTKQISPHAITAVNHSADTLTVASGTFGDDYPVRLHARGGTLPTPLTAEKKYYIRDYSAGVFKVSETEGGAAVPLTDNGSGTITMWEAVAGLDDPDQGLPEYCPEVETTFSGICYVEGLIPAVYSEAVEPIWEDFRFVGIGRILMDYDEEGDELGTTTDPDLCSNPALCDADNLIVGYRKPKTRIDWPSWAELKADSAVKLWQRIDAAESGVGFIGQYYNFTGSVPPDIGDATLVLTRRDPVISFDFGIGSPGVPVNDDFIAVFTGRLKPKYSETYTFTVERDNGVVLKVDGTTVINEWTNTFGTSSGTKALTADTFVSIRLEFFDAAGPGKLILKWESPSQPVEVIPMQAVYEDDIQVNRYEANMAAAAPIEAATVHESIIQRCPGWDWTDRDGKIVYLQPDRPIVYDFNFDAEDPDAINTFLDRSFQKKRRHRRDRKNFALYSYRYIGLEGYPEQFVEENREKLRELQGGIPDNDPPTELMVMSRSLAQRIAALDMKFTSDPVNDLSLSSQKPSGVVTKSTLVRVRNWVKGDRRIENSICIVTRISRQGNKLDFDLLPVPHPFYGPDDIVSEEIDD